MSSSILIFTLTISCNSNGKSTSILLDMYIKKSEDIKKARKELIRAYFKTEDAL
jgi:hypothetical protein